MREGILSIIKAIENKCTEAHRSPVCAPYVQVYNTCTQEQRESLDDVLNELYEDRVISVWRAINDKMIKSNMT